jgi:hypothetical protein
VANLDFYGLENDQRELFQFLFAETDIIIYELSSAYDREPRQFRSLAEVEAGIQLGGSRTEHLQLWSPSVMTAPVFRRIRLTGVPGHSFRVAVEGAGLIQLYLDGAHESVIHHSHYGHWNEAGARSRSIHSPDDCDWRALAKLSGRIQRHIRRSLAAAKLHARPVLRQAYSAVEMGSGLWFGPEVYRAESTEIRRGVA